MGITDLIFGGERVSLGKKLIPTVGLLEFDCSLAETHTEDAEVTDHPVELGATISDHIRTLPVSVEINGLITNTPLVYLASLFAKSPVKMDLSFPVHDRVDAAYKKLIELKDGGALIDVVTSLRTYSDMAITSISVSRDAANGNVLNCTVALREIKTSISLALDMPIPDDVANKAEEEMGKKSKENATQPQTNAATAPELESMLSSVTGVGA